jgi:hypothetical protein
LNYFNNYFSRGINKITPTFFLFKINSLITTKS